MIAVRVSDVLTDEGQPPAIESRHVRILARLALRLYGSAHLRKDASSVGASPHAYRQDHTLPQRGYRHCSSFAPSDLNLPTTLHTKKLPLTAKDCRDASKIPACISYLSNSTRAAPEQPSRVACSPHVNIGPLRVTSTPSLAQVSSAVETLGHLSRPLLFRERRRSSD